MNLLSSLAVAFAFILIGIGLVLFPLPIPVGLPLVIIGLVLLIKESRWAKAALRWLRTHYPRVDRTFTWIETRAPTYAARILRPTRPRKLMKRLKKKAPERNRPVA